MLDDPRELDRVVEPIHDAVRVIAVRPVVLVLVRGHHFSARVDEPQQVAELVDQLP